MNKNHTEPFVYLNGEFIPAHEAHISIMDRGFLFADSVYEVIPVYNGKTFKLDEHLQRLDNSLTAIRIDNPLSLEKWRQTIQQLVEQFAGKNQSVYLQVTRGVAQHRDFIFPQTASPTVLIMTSLVPDTKQESLLAGINAITLDDIRWHLCRIKATTLLANVLARQQAADQDCSEAILVRDGYAMEGAASNLFIVEGDTIITPPKGDKLLPGVTRDLILELAANKKIPYAEQMIELQRLQKADEIWMSSSVREIVPVIRLDQQVVSDGEPGTVWRKMNQLYREYKQSF